MLDLVIVRNFGRHNATHDAIGHLDDGHFKAESTGYRCDFKSDVARADNDGIFLLQCFVLTFPSVALFVEL